LLLLLLLLLLLPSQVLPVAALSGLLLAEGSNHSPIARKPVQQTLQPALWVQQCVTLPPPFPKQTPSCVGIATCFIHVRLTRYRWFVGAAVQSNGHIHNCRQQTKEMNDSAEADAQYLVDVVVHVCAWNVVVDYPGPINMQNVQQLQTI
jgi:hypothetical protein